MNKSVHSIEHFNRFKNVIKCVPSRMNKLLLLLLVFSLSSCYTSKKLDYLQSKQKTVILPLNTQDQYRIQPADVLSVRVQSRDPEQAAFFNVASAESPNFQADPASLFLTGYTVDSEGKINLAIVGEHKVSDFTVEEIRDNLQQEIDKYLLNSTVTVQLTSFKITVMGDVKSPGVKYMYNSEATIFEGLSSAGDLNFTAKRKVIKVIRQVKNESVIVSLDLTKPSILKSPYYFLHPNDVIYVETSKQNISQKNLGVLSLVLSAITTTVLVLNFATSN